MLRLVETDPPPLSPGESAVLVVERAGDRRAAAERWWRHESDLGVEVREALVWALRFGAGELAQEQAAALAELRGPGQGLLCNPNSQAWAQVSGPPPLDWIRRTAAAGTASKGA